ncbi:hypothetical protein DFJ58DRAFT_774232 [Suillus subalutaceus]|uniref:uncharacterized protein n=1 Tax=Suillus subalutaceus TaxID=48586 RepID=UPI001B861FBB|nr:uncharacterized protein DFJ58DRAFT_774232 [Suillus subalutaceus]KAG1863636.1 hypothetical protein DFJ58DRAFT_774232 [Suillus subalutaceus]
MATLVQFLRWAHPLIGTIINMCTISNAMGLNLVHRPSMRKKSCFQYRYRGTGGRFIAHATDGPRVHPRQLLQLVLKLCLQLCPAVSRVNSPSEWSCPIAGLGLIGTSHGVKILPPLFWSPCWEISERSWVEACECKGKRSVLWVCVSYW